jgi:hypothetical protein
MAVALAAYGNDFNNSIPVGPIAPSALDPARPWDSIGSHQLWIAGLTRYDGLGVLVPGGWLSDAQVLVCPFDGDSNLKTDLPHRLGGPADVYGSYAYRQLDQRGSALLTLPGNNTLNHPARAMALDWQSEGPAPFAHNSHDYGEFVNVLYSDGHIQFFSNVDRPFGATAADYTALPGSYLHRLDQVWINADWAESNSVSTAPVLP